MASPDGTGLDTTNTRNDKRVTIPTPEPRNGAQNSPSGQLRANGTPHTIRHMAQIQRRNAMTNRPRYQKRPRERRIHAVTAFAHQPCQIPHAPATSCSRYTSRPRR